MKRAELLPDIPTEVEHWLRAVFAECNARITAKLSLNPNAPEQTFDLTWIEALSHHSAPRSFGSGWTVRIESHYLGGMRHYGLWEIADIGLLVFVRRRSGSQGNKVGLLQSKRLYPTSGSVGEETLSDYAIGFARLADPESFAFPLGAVTEFRFDDTSRYGALSAGSEQTKAIAAYGREHGVPTFYQFYNPWTLPFTQRVPIQGDIPRDGAPGLGVRIVPARDVHTVLDSQPTNHHPSIQELRTSCVGEDGFGWRLEEFICDYFLGCREGALFSDINQPSISNLFYRRSGPIAAAIAITIEAP